MMTLYPIGTTAILTAIMAYGTQAIAHSSTEKALAEAGTLNAENDPRD
jgi:hypothetical protein